MVDKGRTLVLPGGDLFSYSVYLASAFHFLLVGGLTSSLYLVVFSQIYFLLLSLPFLTFHNTRV